MNIVIAGGTGFVGRALVKKLSAEGHRVRVLSRKPDAVGNVLWDGRTAGPWTAELERADAVIDLAGEGIGDERWSPDRKARIRSSRIDATRALVQAMGRCSRCPKVLLNASAVGFYGSVPDGEVTERDLKGGGFLADVCADWEEEALKAGPLGVRVALMRFGVVLGKDGGALQKFILPFRLCIGGPLGSGRQWFPWVHRDDVIGALLFALQNETLSGPVNVTAPETVTMEQFCRALGKAMRRPSWAPVPGFVLKMLLGEMSEMVLTGQRAVPCKLEGAGFRFGFGRVETALADLFQK